jgi:DNA invertase Pin-like site-specific DNA recombinase
MPWATPLMLHIHAAFGEHERKEIGKRTKAAIQAKIAKGQPWGVTGQAMADRNRELSDNHARFVAPIFLQLEAEGYTTIRELCAELNKRDVPGPMDNAWNVASTLRYRRKCAAFCA